MYEGSIVQFGPVEELVLNPATDYVRDFTRDISKEKFLTVGSVMGPVSPETSTLSFGAKDLISAVAAKVIEHDSTACVYDSSGNPVGSLSRSHISAVLFPKVS